MLAQHSAPARRRGDRGRARATAVAGRRRPDGPAHAAGRPARRCWARAWTPSAGTTSPQRCLTCGNCTMVCPTCFCTTTEDVTDLTGDHAERWRHWDSCFDLDFSYLHGGPCAPRARSRYRQWLTHKLGTWHDQFGSSGCVGCGRCIVWCPVGIDITEEAHALRAGAARRRQADDRDHDLLPAHPFLAGSRRRTASWLRASRARSTFRGGTPHLRRGRRADRFWLIRTGTSRSTCTCPAAGGVVVETLGPGDLLGWSWLFPPYRWHFGAVAVEPGARLRVRRRRACAAVRRPTRRSGYALCQLVRPGHRRPAAGHPHPAARPVRPAMAAAGRAMTARPVPYRVVRPPARDARHRHARAGAGRRDALPRLRAGPVRDAVRLRRRRDADLGQPAIDGAARSDAHRARRRRRLRRTAPLPAGRPCRACAARSAPAGTWPPAARARPGGRRRRHRSGAAASGGRRRAGRPERVRPVNVLVGARTPADLLYTRASSTTGAAAGAEVRGRPSTAPRPAGAARSAWSPTLLGRRPVRTRTDRGASSAAPR